MKQLVIVTVKLLMRNIMHHKLMEKVIIQVEFVKTNPLAQLEQHGMRNPSSVSTKWTVKMTEKYGMKRTGIVIRFLVQILLSLKTRAAKLKVNTIFTTPAWTNVHNLT